MNFSITDTAAINRDAVGAGRSVMFFEPTIVRVTTGQNGNPKFTTIKIDPLVRAEIEAYLLR